MPESTTTGWKRVAVTVVGLTALMVTLLSAFALPALNSGPHDVPIAVTGEPAGNEDLRERIAEQRPGAFAFTTAADADHARDLIMDREVYGAVVSAPSGTTMLVASAASSTVATHLRDLAESIGTTQGTEVAVEDVRPLPDDDPTGAGLSAGALPLALGGWIGAVVLLMTVRGARSQVAGAAAFAVVAGLALTTLMQYGFGSFDGNLWATAAAAALGISAAAWAILGLRTALGPAGLALGAVALVLLGNPLSGISSAPELLPEGWSTLGQLLPPGATGSLLRSVAYFDGAGAAQPVLVLACWVLGGIVLFAVGTRRANRKSATSPDDVTDDADENTTAAAPKG